MSTKEFFRDLDAKTVITALSILTGAGGVAGAGIGYRDHVEAEQVQADARVLDDRLKTRDQELQSCVSTLVTVVQVCGTPKDK